MYLAYTLFLGLTDSQWTILGAFTAVLATIAGLVWIIVKLVFAAGGFMQRFKTVEEAVVAIKHDIRKMSADLSARIDNLANISIQDSLSEAHSPRQLNATGRKVLKNSGINTVVEARFEQIASAVEKLHPENAYQAEQAMYDVIDTLIDDAAVKDAVENGAFQSGHSIAAVLFVGGLYIRDRVLEKLGFLVTDIDIHAPSRHAKGDDPKNAVSRQEK